METTNTALLHASNTTVQILKLQDELTKYKNELIRFKKQKLEKVNNDYKYHQVYRWLGGSHDNYRPNTRFRTKIRKPSFQTVDASSGDSTSDPDSRGDQRIQLNDTFLVRDSQRGEPPDIPRVGTRGAKRTAHYEEGGATGKNTNPSGRPPRMRK
ncbi:Hypothetical predicted protein [Pelobates cultripes]|uniref:Uncharacterized protein n=1 Tax=Pelobates cultripes TaxID=61616 RepID=A0AAD1VX21_PELCU|nr:Hypothetical predicted protein [Pelobates cultripes]